MYVQNQCPKATKVVQEVTKTYRPSQRTSKEGLVDAVAPPDMAVREANAPLARGDVE